MTNSFPLERLTEIQAAPQDYALIERIPITRKGVNFPCSLSAEMGDEISLVLLDVETTGLDKNADAIIELGLVRILVSPSTGQVTSIVRVESHYNDPGFPIPAEVTELTGITDAMVQGHRIDQESLRRWFEDDAIVVAHNAAFDRRFIDRIFPEYNNARWACSSRGIDWRKLGVGGTKLEYLIYKCGAFYEGHRASIDCLAIAWLFHCQPEATKALLAGEASVEYAIKATGAPFDVKDDLKARRYRWDGGAKVWYTVVPAETLEEEKAFLAALYHRGGERSEIRKLTSRTRFTG